MHERTISSAQPTIFKLARASAWARRAANFLILTLIFALAYSQAPLYTSNQNQYFLHGLAQAGVGFLKQDWLANTLDPTPVFSLLVALTIRYLHQELFFYVFYALQMGVYLYSLLGILASLYDLGASKARYLLLLAALILMHSAALRFALSRSLGVNWTYILEDGVADQRLLGTVFEPSTFGVLLVLSIYLLLQRKPYLAILSATLAATFHPTYLLSAAALTLAYLWITFRESGHSFVKPLLLGLLAMVSVLPILLYVYTNFGATPAETTARAREILVNFRIPHHALISWWFDATAVIKVLFIASALILVRKSRLFPVLLISSLVAGGLTLLQVLLQSDALALIFPWRLSIFLVPLSTSILIAHLLSAAFTRYPDWISRFQKAIVAASLAAILLAVLIGGIRFKLDLNRQAGADDRPVMAFVASHREPGETYLIPTKMQDFRLVTGTPAYVEFKSIPYRDEDVLEWYRRIQLADRFYKNGNCKLLTELSNQEGVDHVILESNDLGRKCPQLQPVYSDAKYGDYLLVKR